MGDKVARDRGIARVAARQHGLITSAQLERVGLGRRGISKRVQVGRLHRLHRGVYAVGHASVGNEGRWLAAVLAYGPGAVLSHRSAAELWEMLPPADGPVHVTVPGDAGRKRRRGIEVHRSSVLSRRDCTRRQGIPVTSPARTLADLRGAVRAAQVRRALRQAEVLGLPLPARDGDHTRSELERRFLALCRRHGLPAPEVNVRIDDFLVDFLWRDRRLIVETDGYRYHRGRAAFEDDRARDLRLKLLGYDVLRLTERQLAAGAIEAIRRLTRQSIG